MDGLHDDGGVLLGVEEKPGLWATGSEGTFGSTPYSRSEAGRVASHLNQKLSRQECRTRPGPGGVQLTYIEGWKVVHEANLIFGFNGWSTTVLSKDIHYIDSLGAGRYMTAVSALVRVTLRDGTTREDYGCGSAEGLRSKGDAISKALKEAVTDATKRALKGFGLRLGLSLYDKEHVREMKKGPPPQRGFSAPPSGPRPQVADGNSVAASRRPTGNHSHNHQQQQHQQRAAQANAAPTPTTTTRPQMQAGAQTNAQYHPGTTRRRQAHTGVQGHVHAHAQTDVQAHGHAHSGGVERGSVMVKTFEAQQVGQPSASAGLSSGLNYAQAGGRNAGQPNAPDTNQARGRSGGGGARHAEPHRTGSTRAAVPAHVPAPAPAQHYVGGEQGLARGGHQAMGQGRQRASGSGVYQGAERHTSAGSSGYGHVGLDQRGQAVGAGGVCGGGGPPAAGVHMAPPAGRGERGEMVYEASPVTPGTLNHGSKRPRIEDDVHAHNRTHPHALSHVHSHSRTGDGQVRQGGTQARRQARAAQVKNEVDELHRMGVGVFE